MYDNRLSKYVSPVKYYRPEYLEFLQSKGRLTLFDFQGEALDSILENERAKLVTERQAMFNKQNQDKFMQGHIKRCKGWFSSIPRRLAHYDRALTDDLYIIAFLMQNLQEYDLNGKNVTYEGMNI